MTTSSTPNVGSALSNSNPSPFTDYETASIDHTRNQNTPFKTDLSSILAKSRIYNTSDDRKILTESNSLISGTPSTRYATETPSSGTRTISSIKSALKKPSSTILNYSQSTSKKEVTIKNQDVSNEEESMIEVNKYDMKNDQENII